MTGISRRAFFGAAATVALLPALPRLLEATNEPGDIVVTLPPSHPVVDWGHFEGKHGGFLITNRSSEPIDVHAVVGPRGIKMLGPTESVLVVGSSARGWEIIVQDRNEDELRP